MRKRNFLKSHHVHQYDRSRYENPLFSHKRQNKYTKWFYITPSIILLFILSVWGLIALPWMKIETISINGLITIDPHTLEQDAWTFMQDPVFFFLPGDHRWLVEQNSLENRLLQNFQLKSITIDKQGRTLLIDTTERITQNVWVAGEKMYFLDIDGYIVRELTSDEQWEVNQQINENITPSGALQTRITTIWNETNDHVDVFAQTPVISNSVLSTIDSFDLLLLHSTIQPISYLIESNDEIWLTVKSTLGVDIYINGVGDAQEQFNNLQLIIDEYGESVHELEYIDLRFGNRVYVR